MSKQGSVKISVVGVGHVGSVVGFLLGVPIGVHSFGRPAEVNADFNISFFVGWRH